MAAISVTVWKPRDGRRQDLLDAMGVAKKIHERLGGEVGVWGAAAGGNDPTAITYTIGHEDMAAYGKFAAAMADDDEWNTFMSAAQGQSDPVADMIDNSVGVSIDV
jgi:hypothetical protein